MKKYKEQNNTRFLYLATIGYDNVFKTQILGWLNLYYREGVEFELLKVDGISKALSRNKKKDFSEVSKRYSGKAKRLLLPPKKANLASAYLFVYLYMRIKSSRKKCVIQTRTHVYYKVFKRLKHIFEDQLYIIYDSRAAKAEEYKYVHLNGSSAAPSAKYEVIKQNEKAMVAISDRILCVSNQLIKYHREQNPQIAGEKFILYPGNADAEIFSYDENVRKKLRSELGVADKTVIIYSGGLSMPWHLADDMFAFYKKISNHHPGMIFLLLSRDYEEAEKLRKKHKIPEEEIKIISCDNHEVPAYLNTADAGLLLRENVPMNNVASPTKFTEYQLCGLPVIISEGVGDFSDYIKESGFGVCLSEENSEDQHLLDFFQENLRQLNRKEISEKAAAKYAKQAVLPQMIQFYKDINGKHEN